MLYGVAIPPYRYVNRPRVRAIIASAALGVATNVMVTSLILIRLAMTWLTIRKSFPDRKTPHIYTDIAAILVESAAPLAVFGICFITTTAINYLNPPNTIDQAGKSMVLSSMFDWLYYSFCVSDISLSLLLLTKDVFGITGLIPSNDHFPGRNWPFLEG